MHDDDAGARLGRLGMDCEELAPGSKLELQRLPDDDGGCDLLRPALFTRVVRFLRAGRSAGDAIILS